MLAAPSGSGLSVTYTPGPLQVSTPSGGRFWIPLTGVLGSDYGAAPTRLLCATASSSLSTTDATPSRRRFTTSGGRTALTTFGRGLLIDGSVPPPASRRRRAFASESRTRCSFGQA